MAANEEEIRTVTLDRWAGARITALIAAAVAIMLVLTFLLTNGGEEVFHRKVVLRTYMADGTGLVRTANVLLNGIDVGEVRSVSLSKSTDPKRAVIVELNVFKNYLPAIPDDSRTEITADNLLGDKYINIRKGKSPRSAQAGSELGVEPPAASNFDPSDLITSMQSILQRIDQTLDQIEDPSTSVGQFVQGEDLYRQLLGYVSVIQTAIQKYDNPRSGIGRMVYGQDLYRQLRQPLIDIDRMLSDIEEGKGAAGEYYATTKQYDRLLATVREFRKSVNEFRRQPMMKSDDMYRSLLETMRRLNDAVDALNRGNGTFGQLLTSEQLYESLAGSSSSARDFLRDFRTDPRKYLRVKVF